MEKQEEIKVIAYHLWEEEGRPYGKDLEHYYRAETIYQQQQSPTGTADILATNAGRQDAEAHEGHGSRTGHHRRRRGEHHHSDRGEERGYP